MKASGAWFENLPNEDSTPFSDARRMLFEKKGIFCES
jgi:hypothetical protein